MSDEKKLDLEGYEALKRSNRRRLFIVSGAVAAAVLTLLAVNSGNEDTPPQKAVVVQEGKQPSEPSAKPSENGNKAETAAATPKAAPSDSVEILKPETIAPPEDVGAPLVIEDDKLADSNIKGLEESEKLQEIEAAKAAEAARAAEERSRRIAEQRAARKAEQRKAAEAKEAEQKRIARNEKAAAERKAKQADAKQEAAAKAKREAAKAKEKETAAAERRKAEKDSEAAQVKAKAKTETAAADKKKADKPSENKAKTAEKTTGGKAAIQAGYAEKERALSLQKKMKAAGINAGIIAIPTDKGTVYRVKSEPYKNAREAERDLNKLRVHGIAGQITRE
ncbi:cell division protein FtsN [Neisseria sp. ZJ106]|uniref:Cell division protein FtsN n=1 Tax=Neisseria lisongii TaxID=2912188 RepID=A0ABY7RH32_9NEIS|nr:cell division protein FtsN [Neisseria lisongii]MCF7521745.1 cell division protein FtsN [Neisseria lisongii]WCL70815.1 cell division protein FtsN [Neisseria lisongii]